MTSLTIFTSMTNPDARNDAWREALECYKSLADEVVIVGEDWPTEFEWDYIGNTFQEGFDKSNSDWVIRMDIDYFFHEKDFDKIRNALDKYKNYPCIAFPQYQFFTPNRYQLKTRLCAAFNKNRYPQIKLNGGGDLTLATLNGKLIDPKRVPNLFVPIYQYESTFRTKSIIQTDRGRFARAWYRYFGEFNDRGGATDEEAYNAWFKMVQERFPKHNFKLNIDKHPKFIQDKLRAIKEDQFGYDVFGLIEKRKFSLKYFLKGMKEKYVNHILLKIKNLIINY